MNSILGMLLSAMIGIPIVIIGIFAAEWARSKYNSILAGVVAYLIIVGTSATTIIYLIWRLFVQS